MSEQVPGENTQQYVTPREPLRITQEDSYDCGVCRLANVVYMLDGNPVFTSVAAIKSELLREDARPTNAAEETRFLLDQGFEVRDKTAFNPNRFQEEGVGYFRDFVLKYAGKDVHDALSDEAINNRKESLKDFEDPLLDYPNYSCEFGEWGMGDVKDLLEEGYVVLVNAKYPDPNAPVHALVIYGVWNPENYPDVDVFQLYRPSSNANHTLEDRSADDLAREINFGSTLGAVRNRLTA